MRVIPAIDLIDGRCVRLREGAFVDPTVYADDPVALVASLRDNAIPLVHVVDLDGAREGWPMHTEMLAAMTALDGIDIQIGGGLRTTEGVEAMLASGALRVVVGSIAITDPVLLASWIEAHGTERFVVALDVREREVAIAGWQQNSGRRIEHVLDDLLAIGVRSFLCTDIARDGVLAGPALELYRDVCAQANGAEIIASGGIRDRADLIALESAGLDGAVVGRAWLEGRIDVNEIGAWNASRVVSTEDPRRC